MNIHPLVLCDRMNCKMDLYSMFLNRVQIGPITNEDEYRVKKYTQQNLFGGRKINVTILSHDINLFEVR